TTHFEDPELIAEVSRGLGEAMKGIEIGDIAKENLIQFRGW
ncbi:MAG: pyridoxal 5'-phosphate synthase lyase subunit PdxS, partial [Candidatus Geothermincolia bacterium]